MQAIQTRYLCPTNFKGSRIKAECARGSITVRCDDALNMDANHVAAANALLAKFNAEDLKDDPVPEHHKGSTWLKPFATGQLPNGNYVHVFTT